MLIKKSNRSILALSKNEKLMLLEAEMTLQLKGGNTSKTRPLTGFYD